MSKVRKITSFDIFLRTFHWNGRIECKPWNEPVTAAIWGRDSVIPVAKYKY